MIRALVAVLVAWVRQLGHQHTYTARILSADRTTMIDVPTAFCATCGKYPR